MNFTFVTFVKRSNFLCFTPFIALTPVSQKMFVILYALFAFSLIQNVACYDTIENTRHFEPGVVRLKRNDNLSERDLDAYENEPKADKLVSKDSIYANHPTGVQKDRSARAEPPRWTKPDMMQRQVVAKPINQIVSWI